MDIERSIVREPNFFIIGFPKCGTTAISEYLRFHPNVFMSDPKEPNYFSSDVVRSNYRTRNEYMELFARARPGCKVIAEASTTYIYSSIALQKILQFWPPVKLLVMLRQPVDLVYAYHGQKVLEGIEPESDFETAWNLQDLRAGLNRPPHPYTTSKVLQYRWIGSIGSHLKNVLHKFPRNQVHIILLDDLMKNPRVEYLRLLSFLDLPDDGRSEFPRVNGAKAYKLLWLGQVLRRLRGRLGRPFSILERKFAFQGTGLIKTVDRFNVSPRPRPPLRPEFRQYLNEVFYDEVLLLEELLGRDLSAWHYQGAMRA